MKQCLRCSACKPPEMFGKSAKSRDGLSSYCAACHSESAKASYAKNRERIKAERNAKYAAAKDRYNEVRRQGYAANPDRFRNAMKGWREKNPAYATEATRKWKLKYPSKAKVLSAAATARYRARKLQATPAWADPTKIAEFYFAADFLGMVTGEWHHVDHSVPLQGRNVCGLHVEHNLQILPGPDNIRKSNKWPI